MNQKKVFELKQGIMRATQVKDYSGALRKAEKLVKLVPEDIEAWYALSQLQERAGQIEAAVRSLYRVCQRPSPVHETALRKSIELCKQGALYKLGIAPAEAMVKLKPQSSAALFDLGLFWFHLQQFISAREFFKKAMALDPEKEIYARYCALSYIYSGNVKEGGLIMEEFIERFGASEETAIIRAIASNYPMGLDETEQVFAAHRAAGDFIEGELSDGQPFSDYRIPDKVRIAYLSPDFCNHSVAFFFRALVEAHNRNRFEVICLSDVVKGDAVTEQIKSTCDNWIDVSSMDNEALCELVRKQKIDVLVDLVGYAGRSRAGVFARRAAPVQVTYLGFPNTTGLTRMDYRITDAWSDPEGMTESLYTESLMRLPGGFLCYTPQDDVPPVSPLPSRKNGRGICFGSFNSFLKISPELLSLWAGIMRQVDGSTLFMKTKPLAEKALREQVWQQLEAEGIAKERVRLQGWTENIDSHLELYNDVDIHLDTFPYNGTTTTVESLRQGVPIVTLAGRNHRSRVGLSLLKQIGLDEWIATSESEYVACAVRMATDPDRLEALRESLRARVDSSSLCDRERFIPEIESAYENMLTERARELREV